VGTAIAALPPAGAAQGPRVLAGPHEMAAISRDELERASRQAWQFASLGRDRALCRVLTRYLFYVDTRDMSLVPHLALNGCWEPWITQAIARCLAPGQHCLDIGANHGYYAVLMADAVGPDGWVLAAEPNPELTGLLGRTLEVNGLAGHVEVVESAVTDRARDMAVLRVPTERSGGASLYATGGADEQRLVCTTTVDELVEGWPRVDLVKIDVEGAEERVWRGMSATLERNPSLTVLTELCTDRHYDAGAFLARVQAAGFRLRHVNWDSQIEDVTVAQCLTERTEWMLWLRRD
jgi:FkbM family methyltransferase